MTPADYSYIVLFAAVGIGFAVANIGIISWLLRPYRPYRAKLATYECGEEIKGKAHVQFRVGYYIFALIFVVLDVDAVFFYPWAVVLRRASKSINAQQLGANPGLFAFAEIALFTFIIAVALGYAWRKSALDWD